ncbi:hypothetical protein DFH07DRAFT_963302 [Mycena maculata]|uniref:Uncharacterized protein n=1 Tax=Mycena maculata TaxID=230809 RepID=A0AAD7N5K6_9AGAR|nr:hypothetical protein DFH07DRAFT_963302 [Mycena maculata]
MPFANAPSMPAQTHLVKLRPPGLDDVSVWAYLALAFVIISIIGVLYYAAYSFYHALNLNVTPLPQYSVKSPSKTKRAKKPWRPSTSSSSQEKPMLAEIAMDHDTVYVDRRMSMPAMSHADPTTPHIPLVAFPGAAAFPPTKPRNMPTYDMHNIRFASPSNPAIYANPKLAPVVGSAIPLSYDSHDNLFANPFTPTASRKGEATRRGLSSPFSSAFQVKGKTKNVSRGSGKENLNVLVNLDAEVVPLKDVGPSYLPGSLYLRSSVPDNVRHEDEPGEIFLHPQSFFNIDISDHSRSTTLVSTLPPEYTARRFPTHR